MVVVQEKVDLREGNVNEDPQIVLQNLTRAESTLLKEKKKLATTKAKLESEVKKQIENKMNTIQKLRDEITNLKSSCDELSKTLQNPKKG
jgi:predicted DNA-binding protein YlxM (UPF0122 family)